MAVPPVKTLNVAGRCSEVIRIVVIRIAE